MISTANLGFPRIGIKRELKKAVEAYWQGRQSSDELHEVAKHLRHHHWQMQQDVGLTYIPSNDFSLYDHVLDTTAMVGAVPARYQWQGEELSLATYFAMARGQQSEGRDVVAMEMTKWFDTNYHYLVPEFSRTTTFKLTDDKVVQYFKEAKALGIHTRPVLLGPVSYLLLGKSYDDSHVLSHLDQLLAVYQEILSRLFAAGADWVQIDEPCLVLDLDDAALAAYKKAYQKLAEGRQTKIILTTYFGDLRDNLATALSLPVDGLHVDLVRHPEQLGEILESYPPHKILSLGLIDGRNIWKTDLQKALQLIEKASAQLGTATLIIAPSCSLLHCPIDLDDESNLDAEFRNWLAFAKQKLDEIVLLGKVSRDGRASEQQALENNAQAVKSRKTSTRIHNERVKDRMNNLTPADFIRSPFQQRIKAQKDRLDLPPLPTTTIGSFPQTAEIRQMRANYKKGQITTQEYENFLAQQTRQLIQWQDEIGIDVPVHGEYERNDMVEYFGEQLAGYAFTKNGWVQSYGSRCVKPPIIFGDVSRPQAMTVRWSAYAQQFTQKPVKGMLTGPITMLQWAFVRDDQARELTCQQIALAIRDEVKDLEEADIKLIQIDEPAFREGLPLRKGEWEHYLAWAVQCFRLASSGIQDQTQIHTHMCYSEFNDIIPSIAELDADVISIETSRSAMELLDAFSNFSYPNHIGPGVYDIHSPRVPTTAEMETLLRKALKVFSANQLWVNPDCGLKTRSWDEVRTSLQNMVAAARKLRTMLARGDRLSSKDCHSLDATT